MGGNGCEKSKRSGFCNALPRFWIPLPTNTGVLPLSRPSGGAIIPSISTESAICPSFVDDANFALFPSRPSPCFPAVVDVEEERGSLKAAWYVPIARRCASQRVRTWDVPLRTPSPASETWMKLANAEPGTEAIHRIQPLSPGTPSPICLTSSTRLFERRLTFLHPLPGLRLPFDV